MTTEPFCGVGGRLKLKAAWLAWRPIADENRGHAAYKTCPIIVVEICSRTRTHDSLGKLAERHSASDERDP